MSPNHSPFTNGPRRPVQRPAQRGFSLIELLVAMVIGLVLTLAITTVMVRSEGSKRSSTSVNDINQMGAYTTFLLDRTVRTAGSGFSQRWSDAYGCLLDISRGATRVLPMPSAIPAASAFANVTQPVRLAPVIIGKGLADSGTAVRGDVLTVMAGTGGVGEIARSVLTGSVTTDRVHLINTIGFATGDLVLLVDRGVAAGCMMQQVTFAVGAAGSVDQVLPLSGTYFNASGTLVNLTDFGANTFVSQIGNAVNNPPQFQMFGVGANNTLFSYDLLQPSAPDVAVAEGVVEMRALYGVDTSVPQDGVLDSWVDPVTGSGFEAAVLTSGSAVSRRSLRQIVAIRLGIILRTSLEERSVDYQQPVGTVLTLFGDLGAGLAQTRTLTGRELNHRFRTFEVTIPLRNVLLAPAT